MKNPVMIGQVYERVVHPMTLEIQQVNSPRAGLAMAHMSNDRGDYGVKPVPHELLRSCWFRLVATTDPLPDGQGLARCEECGAEYDSEAARYPCAPTCPWGRPEIDIADSSTQGYESNHRKEAGP